MDIENLGIYGSSAGGQESTNALLLALIFTKPHIRHADVMTTAWTRYGWNECGWVTLWIKVMRECSNVANAHLLGGVR